MTLEEALPAIAELLGKELADNVEFVISGETLAKRFALEPGYGRALRLLSESDEFPFKVLVDWFDAVPPAEPVQIRFRRRELRPPSGH